MARSNSSSSIGSPAGTDCVGSMLIASAAAKSGSSPVGLKCVFEKDDILQRNYLPPPSDALMAACRSASYDEVFCFEELFRRIFRQFLFAMRRVTFTFSHHCALINMPAEYLSGLYLGRSPRTTKISHPFSIKVSRNALK